MNRPVDGAAWAKPARKSSALAPADPAFDATRLDTLGHINTARSGIEAIKRMDKADLHQFDMFCLLALGGDRMIRNS